MNEAIKTIRQIGESLFLLADQMEAAMPSEDFTTQDKTDGCGQEQITMEEVRAVLSEISRNGKTAEMRALLAKYGVYRLSDLKPEDYAAILAEAEAINNA